MFIVSVGMLECGSCKQQGVGVVSMHHDGKVPFQINYRCLACFALLAKDVPLFKSIRSLVGDANTSEILDGLEKVLKRG